VPADLRVEHPASIPDFYTEARDYLLEHEAEHGLMLSVAFATLIAPAESYWSVVRARDGRVVAAALRTMPKMMLSREEGRAPGAMAALAEDARQANFDSIIGPRPSLEAFAAAYGGSWRPTQRHVLYECRAVHQVPIPRGERCVVSPADRSRVADWIQAFSAEAIGDGATRDAAKALTDRHLRDGSMWLRYSRHDPTRFVSAAQLLAGEADPELLRSKLVLLGAAMIAAPVAADIVVMAIYQVPAADIIGVSIQTAQLWALWIGALVVAAAITPNLAKYALLIGSAIAAAIVAISVLVAVTMYRDLFAQPM